MGIKLNDLGESIVRRGGHDDISDDELVFLELVKRAPGLSQEDYQKLFVALRMQCGEDALYALQNGHVTFEERPAGERSAEPAGE